MRIRNEHGSDDILEMIRQKIVDNPLLEQTAITLTAVYYEIRMGLSTYGHETVMELLKRFKIVSPQNYCFGRKTAGEMALSIAKNMNERLKTALQASNYPSTITLDG